MSNAAMREEGRAADTKSEFLKNAGIAWSYKVAHNYMDGCKSGEAAAISYIQYAKVRPRTNGGNLQHAAVYFAEEFRNASTKGELDAIRGKMVGFFSEIDRWVDFAAKHATSQSLNASFDDIIRKLEDASSGAAMREWEKYLADVRSDRARTAARARWDKQKRTI
ncbi:hypothetical protein [Burkholderia pseudomallei]|uniref:hypothetical protein n=1 Tax=Burkholderia pseudomallei TaxID=28450 RepID=UPI00100BEEA4|nr:hypothetical protein [Burkholderia pseudomallei]